MSEFIGTFRGTVLSQGKGDIGGARSVFAKFKGITFFLFSNKQTHCTGRSPKSM